jgi:hypothetical protein
MFQIETINGKRIKTQTVHYPSTGRVTKRIFDNAADVIPSDIIIVAFGKHIGPAPVQC